MFNRKGVVYKYFVRLLSLQSKASDVWTHSHSLFLTVTKCLKTNNSTMYYYKV